MHNYQLLFIIFTSHMYHLCLGSGPPLFSAACGSLGLFRPLSFSSIPRLFNHYCKVPVDPLISSHHLYKIGLADPELEIFLLFPFGDLRCGVIPVKPMDLFRVWHTCSINEHSSIVSCLKYMLYYLVCLPCFMVFLPCFFAMFSAAVPMFCICFLIYTFWLISIYVFLWKINTVYPQNPWRRNCINKILKHVGYADCHVWLCSSNIESFLPRFRRLSVLIICIVLNHCF